MPRWYLFCTKKRIIQLSKGLLTKKKIQETNEDNEHFLANNTQNRAYFFRVFLGAPA
jgi:hypothetical protein